MWFDFENGKFLFVGMIFSYKSSGFGKVFNKHIAKT